MPTAARGLGAKFPVGRFALAATCVAVDAATKAWAGRALAGRATVWVVRPWLSLELVHNRGGTLGFGAGDPLLWTLVAAAAVPFLVMMLARSRAGLAGAALLLGGAAGNLLSRLVAGSVTDFVHLWPWPGVFNAADVFLRVGALLVIVALLREGKWNAEGASRSC